MKKSVLLKKELAALSKATDLQAVLDKFSKLKDGESLSAEDQAIVAKYNTDCAEKKKAIEDAEAIEKAMADAAPDPVPTPTTPAGPTPFQKAIDAKAAQQRKGTPEQQKVREYSIVKAMRLKSEQLPLEGVEKEMQQEAIKEASEHGVGNISGIGLPSFFVNPKQKIAQAGGGDPTLGANTINTTLRGPIGPIEPKIAAIDMGCQVMTGLRGKYELIKDSAIWEARWEGEFTENKEEDLNDTKIPMEPHRLGAKTRFSSTIFVQSSLDVEARVRRKLSFSIGNKLDKTIINGSGVGNIPEGILNNADVNVISLGANGDAPTWPKMVEAMKTIQQQDADRSSYGILTTPLVMGALMTTKIDAGSGVFIADKMGNTRIVESTNVPSNLDKGTTQDQSLHALLAGYWSSCVLGNWSGVDLIIDNITRGDFGEIKVIANTFWDIAFEYGEAFSVIKDIKVN